MGARGGRDDISLHLSDVESINALNRNDCDDDGMPEDVAHRQLARREYAALFYLKLSVVGILIVAAIALSVSAYYVTAKAEHSKFVSDYEGYATKIIDAYLEDSALRLWTAHSLSTDFTAEFGASNTWPFVTMTNFSRRTVGLGYIAKANSLLFAPLVTNTTRVRWEQYAIDNQYLVHADDFSATNQTTVGIDGAPTATHLTSSEAKTLEVIKTECGDSYVPMFVEDGILAYAGKCEKAAANGPGPFFPIWEMAPWRARHFMMDLMSFDFLKNQLHAAIEDRKPQLSMTIVTPDLDATAFSTFLFPVFGGFFTDAPVVGVISLAFLWVDFFKNILPVNAVGLQLVLSNTCGQAFTFELNGPDVTYVGDTDSHDSKYDDLVFACAFEPKFCLSGDERYCGTTTHFSESNLAEKVCSQSSDAADDLHLCKYSIRVYPSDRLRDTFTSSNPALYTTVIALIFVFTSMVFLAYDYLVERRQQIIAKTAARSDAIVQSLYPARFRDRVYLDSQNNDVSHQPSRPRRSSDRPSQHGALGPIEAMQSINSSVQGYRDDDSTGRVGRLPMLPETPKVRLKSYLFDAPTVVSSYDFGSEPIAEMFTDTTIMFADISGFTAWSSEREPPQVFILLETLYRAFDAVAHRLGVFKVETIGDCYVAVVGLPDPNEHHAVVMTYFGYECIRQMKELVRELEATLGPGTSDLCMRVGLHSGPVTAGVLRGEKSRFQLFGDSVNTAARMESTGQPNLIHASQETADLLVACGKVSWVAARDDVVSVKGKGTMQTFWLKPRRGSAVGYTYLMETSSNASSTIDSKPKHRTVTPQRTLSQKQALSRLGNDSPSACSASSPTSNGQEDFNKWGNLSLDEALTAKASVGNQKKASQKMSRLVDWNVDLLMSFLAKVVSNRDGLTAIRRLEHSIDHEHLRSERSTSILNEVTEVILLPDYDNGKRLRSQTEVVLPSEVREQLHDFVSRIATMYRDIPFHNLEHASHVTMSAVKLMRRIINPDDVDGDPREVGKADKPAKQQLDGCFYRNLHESTFGISSDPLTQFCLVFAALIHVSKSSPRPNSLTILFSY